MQLVSLKCVKISQLLKFCFLLVACLDELLLILCLESITSTLLILIFLLDLCKVNSEFMKKLLDSVLILLLKQLQLSLILILHLSLLLLKSPVGLIFIS
jgi:hypothetical protein